MRKITLVALSAVLMAVMCTAEQQLSAEELEKLVEDILTSDSSATSSAPTFYFTRHMLGSWTSVWTHACPPKGDAVVSSTGTVTVSNISSMSFKFHPATRYLPNFDNREVVVDLQGEGARYPYAPFLRSGAIPGIGKRGGRDASLGYQLCTVTKNRINTFTEETKMLGEETETIVHRGFIFEEHIDSDGKVLVLDRCVDGLNRNFNFILTTVGEPLPQEETNVAATSYSDLTRKLRLVRMQFRLPGSMKCQKEDGVALQTADIDEIRSAAPSPYDYAADEAWDVVQWTRADPVYQSFFDRHFAMLVFAVLFIFFRIFTGYRYNSQKLEIQKSFLQEVQADEEKNKQAILAAAAAQQQQQRKGGKGAKRK